MNLLIETIRGISYALVSPTLSLMLLIIAVIFYFKNKKIALMQKLMLGRSLKSPLEMTLLQILMGILGGVIGSLILSFLGISFENGFFVNIILTVSIVSIMYKNRFMKLPYIVFFLGIIGILINRNAKYLGANFNFSINLTAIAALVSVLAIVEGILIILDGDKGYLPVFAQKNGLLVGGFGFRRFWILPLCLLVFLGKNDNSFISEIGNIPSYLPFLRDYGDKILMGVLSIGTIASYGVVSYEGVTFTLNKKRKLLQSGSLNIIYGLIILLLAYFLRGSYFLTVVLILLIPFIYLIKSKVEFNLEERREPVYFSKEDSICILDVLPNSIAYKKGIRGGDRIIKIDGNKPKSEKDIFKALKENFYGLEMEVKNIKGEITKYTITSNDRRNALGIVLVPKGESFEREIDEFLKKIQKASKDKEIKK